MEEQVKSDHSGVGLEILHNTTSECDGKGTNFQDGLGDHPVDSDLHEGWSQENKDVDQNDIINNVTHDVKEKLHVCRGVPNGYNIGLISRPLDKINGLVKNPHAKCGSVCIDSDVLSHDPVQSNRDHPLKTPGESDFQSSEVTAHTSELVNCISNCTHACPNVSTRTVVSDNDASHAVSGTSRQHHVVDCIGQPGKIEYVPYHSERQMPDIMRLFQKDLSEPYSIYTYRYFIHNWPKLCFLAMDKDVCVGAIVCKLDVHKKLVKRGYIAMLAVDENYRKRKIGSNLVLKAIRAMICDDADEVVLETEITNKPALRLYENLGFVRDKRLFRYYLNGVDALRLKLWLR